jgi:hypothetical protein
MGEAKFMSGMISGKDFINAKLKNYPKAKTKVNQLIDMIGESKFTIEMAEWIFDFFNNAHFESPINEASTISVPKLSDIDHTRIIKWMANQFDSNTWDMKKSGKGFEIAIDKLSKAEQEDLMAYLKSQNYITESHFKVGDKVKMSHGGSGVIKSLDKEEGADEDLYTKVNEEELTEAYVPSNIKEFAKRKGVSSLVNKVAGWAEKVGAGIRGGTAIGYNYSTLILDMTYQGSEIRINTDNDTVTLYDEPVNSFPEFKSVYLDNKEEDNNLEERIHEALNKINEELCPAGKAYIKKRKAAGEKSSAYLSGRAVKVCKGQMSGKAKKK